MDTKTINRKIISGFFTLTFRRAALFGVMWLNNNLLLARILPPETIGIFNIATSVLMFFTYFSDIGLGAALIQKKEITRDDLITTFTIQQLMAAIIAVVVWFLAPWFASIYQLDASGMWLIRALGFGFFLTSFKVLPSVMLERDLKFAPLVIVEILETIVYLGVLDYLILNNFGVSAYTYSVLGRGIMGVVAIYIFAPWKIGFGISKQSAKELVRFGAPFQLNSMLALLKDRLVDLVVAGIIGKAGVGYVTWARNIAYVPLEVMNIMGRITFPAFSRLQHDNVALKKTLEKSLFFTSLFMYPLSFGIIAIAPSIITYIVRSNWSPALPLIYLFSISAFWAALSTPMTNFLNAIGKISTTLKLMVMWTIVEWAVTPFFAIQYGFIGVGIASFIISFTSIAPIIIVKRIINFDLFKSIYKQFICGLIMFAVVFFLAQNYIYNWQSLIVVILLGGLVYTVLALIILKKEFLLNLKELRNEA